MSTSTETEKILPRPGIVQSSYKLSGFKPGTFRSSVWRSPNWAISAGLGFRFKFLLQAVKLVHKNAVICLWDQK